MEIWYPHKEENFLTVWKQMKTFLFFKKNPPYRLIQEERIFLDVTESTIVRKKYFGRGSTEGDLSESTNIKNWHFLLNQPVCVKF